jgi:hypothetical protein
VNYVVAGYSIVLGILFLYAVQLAWRRRRWTRLVARVEASHAASGAAPAAAGDLPSE